MNQTRPTIRLAVAMLAIAVIVLLLWLAKFVMDYPPSPYRQVVEVHRDSSGRTTGKSIWGFNLLAPADTWHGTEPSLTRYNELIDRLNRRGAEYTVTTPRGFTPGGDPIY